MRSIHRGPLSNELLASLPESDLQLLIPHLTSVQLPQGTVIAEPGVQVDHAYFPLSGAVSLLVVMHDGKAIETGSVGREGVVGSMSGIAPCKWQVRAIAQLPMFATKIASTQLSDDPDFEYVLIDGTLVRVHQHGTGAKGGTQNQAIGRSRGGLTTKIMALVDALGNLVRFVLLPGQRHDSIGVEPLITGLDFEALIGDKAFDNNWLRANLNERGAAAVKRMHPRVASTACECQDGFFNANQLMMSVGATARTGDIGPVP